MNLIIGWINYFRKFHGVEQRPCNYLLAGKTPSTFEQNRLKDKNIYVIDLNSLPSTIENVIEIPSSLTDSIGRRMYAFLQSVANPSILQEFIPLETRLMDKYHLLQSYSKISFTDLKNIHPLGHTELIDSTLIFYDEKMYNQVISIVENDCSDIVDVFIRSGITDIQLFSNNHAISICSIEEPFDPVFQLYLDNDYNKLKEISSSITNHSEQIYYLYLLGSYQTLIGELLQKDEQEASSKDYVAILMHKMRSRLATMSLTNRQEKKALELNHLFETCPTKYRKATGHLKMIHADSDQDIQYMAELLEKHEQRYDYQNKTWYSEGVFNNIWRLKACAYNYYFFSKRNYLPLDYFSEPKKYYSFYLKSILCSYLPIKPESTESIWGLPTDLRPYPIGEIEFDMFVKFVNPKTLKEWIKEYSVPNILLASNIDIAKKYD